MHGIDAKWQEKWQKAGVFEPEIGKKGKFMLTPAFPYPNSPQHIGHGRTYTTTDIYARYLRMKGKNVLFPMAFHVTGTPVLAMAKRIAEKDKEILGIFEKAYGISLKTAESLTDPKKLVAYFSNEIEHGMKEMGYSIDWSRKFYSYDAPFNKFIHWQFKKLKNAGYITKGEHPVPWCPVSKTAVGAHDTQGDLDPQIEEVTGVMFPYEDGFLVCSTYRPETIYGVTNIWVNPSAEYVKASDGKRNYYISKDALGLLSMQLPIKEKGKISAKEILSKKAKNPINGKELPIFEAGFVDPKHGTGVVMSVPAHAPYDYLALRDAGLDKKVKMVQVLTLSGFGKNPAKEFAERMKVKSQKDPKAEQATTELYKKEAHEGIMAVGEFKGMKGVEAKEKISEKLVRQGHAIKLYEIANGPIYSRYKGLVGVKIVKDQWFIDYGNEEWKKKARECLKQMNVFPEKSRKDYEYTIGWLKQKACTRASGLGTKFPFDESKMIEALSDSTIYMSFYTIAQIAMKMKPDELTEELLDYVFLGKGNESKMPEQAKKMRRQFTYWYPHDSRHSATDLVRNHLTFFIFNHVGVFEKKYWPKQIVTNGFVLMDGKKMSKSMGNILPIRSAVKKFGADAIRFTIVSGAELSQDTDFNRPAVEGVLSRLKFMRSAMEKYAAQKDPEKKELADRWILSRMHKRAIASDSLYQKFELRELSLELFYNTVNDLQWYLKRTKNPHLREFFEMWVPLIAPFMPHIAEEMWEKLGKKHYAKDAKLVSIAAMPDGDKKKVDENLELAEQYILQVKDDVFSIMKLIKMQKPKKIDLFVAAGWKRKLRKIAAKERRFDSAMKQAMQDAEIKKHGKEAAKVLKTYMKSFGGLGQTPTEEFELEALKSSEGLLEKEIGAKVSVSKEEQSKEKKAANALPGKPSILIL